MKRNHIKPIFIVCYLLAACSSCKNEPTATTDKSTDVPPIVAMQPKDIPYQIVKEFPHDTLSYVEGLQYVDGKLYESAGNYKTSDIRIVDPITGKVLQRHKLEDKYFGEGITVLNGKAYQMSYKENTCFVYDAKTFKLLKTFTYNFGEGWGMTTDGKYLIVSNGSSTLFFINPETFRIVNQINVNNQFGAQSEINELEYIKGAIYANVYGQDVILKIDPANGKVLGKVDMSNLRTKYNFPTVESEGEGNTKPEVMNGIAYDSIDNRIFITGKFWPKLFEVKLDN
jgi:glutamine cyclotransferase